MYHPNKFTLVFFFFFGAAAKDRQLSTRASLPSAQPRYVGKEHQIEYQDNTPSQVFSSSAFLFLSNTSSSLRLASRPSLAKFILMALRGAKFT